MFPLAHFLRQELRDAPGRASYTLRLTLSCAVLITLFMTLQIPFLAVALIVVFYVSQPNVLMIKLVSVVFFVTVTVALGGVLLIIKWTYDYPLIRLAASVALFFCAIYLMRVLGKLGLAFFVVALAVIYAQTFPSMTSQSEILVRLLLWLWVAINTAILVTLLVNACFQQAFPGNQFKARLAGMLHEVARRLTAPGDEAPPTFGETAAQFNQLQSLFAQASRATPEIAAEPQAWRSRLAATLRCYQLAALLMAIRLNGMTAQETTDLTLAMRDSGDVCDLSAIPGKKIDKHSTGGVGDTTTLILAPVAKMSGRGLGHTGGTLDKLESIPGLSVEETEERFIRQVQEIGLAVIGQTAALAPADKTLYALRDVTSTVDSLPLIAASIMSKKLASGADGIVLDVKTGSGALMETLPDALALAQTMVDIGKLAGKPVVAVITSMAQPLGTHIGNALEVKDAIDVLAGRTQGDLLEISLLLGSHMLVLAEKAKTLPEARTMLENALSSGAGLRKLAEMIAAQGGDPRVVEDLSLLPQAAVKRVMRAETAGYLSAMDTTALGMAAQRMGAGRAKKSDMLDYSVGYVLHVRLGDEVTEDTPLATLYARNEAEAEEAEKAIRKALTIAKEKPSVPPLWDAVVTAEGITYNR